MEAVREARLQRDAVAHRPGETAERGRRGRERVVRRGVCAAAESVSQQQLVERHARDLSAELAVCVQESAALALPADVFGGELEGGSGAMHEVGFLDAEQRV